jgi:hypothetical protein
MFNKNKSVIVTAVFAAAVLFFLSTPASAHHEAMFGPQSSAVLSPGMFISLQMFDRERRKGGLPTSRDHKRLQPWRETVPESVVICCCCREHA